MKRGSWYSIVQEHKCIVPGGLLDPMTGTMRIVRDSFRGGPEWRIILEDLLAQESADSKIRFCPYCGTDLNASFTDAVSKPPDGVGVAE